MTITRICVLFILAFLIMPPADAATSPYDEDPDALFAPVYNRLKIALPTNIAKDSTVWLRLDELRREPCDRVSIVGLARRSIPGAFAGKRPTPFTNSCSPGRPRHRAHDVRRFLSEAFGFREGRRGSRCPGAHRPEFSERHISAGARARWRGRPPRALADYATTIELFANKKNISSNVFVNMSKAYAALGRFCEAISPIETWIALDPFNRDTSQAERLIADYSEKGQLCTLGSKAVPTLSVERGTSVAVVKVEINGAAGFFILDTGASFVSVQQDFAKRAHLQTDPGSKMTLHTANGDTSGMLSKADSVKLGALTAKNVSIVVQSSSEKLYGKAIDGLLGLSFLCDSRFRSPADLLRFERALPKISGLQLSVRNRDQSGSRRVGR